MKAVCILPALTLVFAVIQSASAAPSANLTNVERRTLASAYAKCIATKHPALVREYVLQAGTSKQRDDRFRKLADWKCNPSSSSREVSSLYFSSSAALYIFAENLLQSEQLPAANNFANVALLTHPEPMKMESYKASGRLSKEDYAKMVERSIGEAAISQIGECVVRAATSNSRELLNTVIGSEEEYAAIQTILPVAGTCIKDGSIKLKPEHIRGTIALNLYRLTVASMQMEKKPDA